MSARGVAARTATPAPVPVAAIVAVALLALGGVAAAGTVSITDGLSGWNGGAPLTPAPGGSYVEEGTIVVTASGEDVVFDASAGDLARAVTGLNPAATLAVRYEVRREDTGVWSPAFGQGLGASAWTDANVTGTRTYRVRATITTPITPTTLRGAYAAGVSITLTPS